jgi:hypothetical protein
MVLKDSNSYRLDEQGGFLVVIALEASHCPTCQTQLLMRSTRERVCWEGDTDNEKRKLLIRRLYCERCDCIHHELPDCLVPYKRYSANVIVNIIEGQPPKTAPCPDGTVRRLKAWWDAVSPYFLNILLTLVSRFGVSYGNPPAFKETVRAVANSNSWVFAWQICTCSATRPG